MASSNFVGRISLSTTNTVSILLASRESLQPDQRFDMPKHFSIDLNLTSSDAEGVITIFYQNDNPETSPFFTDPVGVPYPISAGEFTGGKYKQTIDSNGVIKTKYMGIHYERTSGTGNIDLDGQITY